MKVIELKPATVRPKFTDFDVIDNLDEGGRKRCSITVDYSEYDVKALIRDGLDIEGAMEHYKERITYDYMMMLLYEADYSGSCYEETDKVCDFIYNMNE